MFSEANTQNGGWKNVFLATCVAEEVAVVFETSSSVQVQCMAPTTVHETLV